MNQRLDVDKYIEELKMLRDLEILPQETKDEIDQAINLAESIKGSDKEEKYEISEENKIPVRFINKSGQEAPKYAKDGDSGFDLRASVDGRILPMQRKLVPTGLYFELPDGYELQIRPRSGLAYKHGITVLNSPGTVDTGYRGEIKVLLINLSDEPYIWTAGERIAQGVIAHRVSSDFGNLIEVEEISETERGSGGFGSTGTK